MTSNENILLRLDKLNKEQLIISSKIVEESKLLPEFNAMGRVSNLLEKLKTLEFEKEILIKILIG